MSEYRSFLEVIKQMQIGDSADCEDKEFFAIKRFEDGVYWINENEEISKVYNGPVEVRQRILELKFKIRPRYVGWEKALRAVEAGKEVEWYLPEHKGVGKWLTFDLSTTLNYAVDGLDITFRDLLESRFLIKEDK